MQEQQIQVKKDNIETVVQLSQQIPEFDQPPGVERYQERLNGVPHLILVAYDQKTPIGFKVGYERVGIGFYSWMGAVLPNYRRLGVAQLLADEMECWAKQKGYDKITFKTRNQHKGMLIFALKNGFSIVGFKEKETLAANRILLSKAL